MKQVAPIDTRWSDISLVEAEVCLFEATLLNQYERIHLLSGKDFPLKPVDEIFDFFSEHQEEEFISIVNENNSERRLKYYHFFTRWPHNVVLMQIRRVLCLLQYLIGVNRLNKLPYEFCEGSQWVSLTQKAIRYIVTEYKLNKKCFQWTNCSDEVYKQTILTSNKSL